MQTQDIPHWKDFHDLKEPVISSTAVHTQGIKQLLHPATAAKIVLCGRDDARLPVDMDAAPPPSPAQGSAGAGASADSPAEERSQAGGGDDASNSASAPGTPVRSEEKRGKGAPLRAEVQAAP